MNIISYEVTSTAFVVIIGLSSFGALTFLSLILFVLLARKYRYNMAIRRRMDNMIEMGSIDLDDVEALGDDL